MDREPSQPLNRRAFFRRGLRQLIQPIAEMAEQMNRPTAAPRPSLARPADGRVQRTSLQGLSTPPSPTPPTPPAGADQTDPSPAPPINPANQS